MDLDLHHMRFLILTFAMVSLLPAAPAGSAEDSQERLTLKRLSTNAAKRKDEGLNVTISAVRSSFIDRDTDRLASCVGNKKVYLSLKLRTGEAGYYTRSQVHFIFDKMFRDHRTRSFEYSPSDITISEEGRAFVRSEWTYVVLGSDTVVTENLRFLFEKEKDGWQISEIKASSR